MKVEFSTHPLMLGLNGPEGWTIPEAQ